MTETRPGRVVTAGANPGDILVADDLGRFVPTDPSGILATAHFPTFYMDDPVYATAGPLVPGGIAGAAVNGVAFRNALEAARAAGGGVVDQRHQGAQYQIDWIDLNAIPHSVGSGGTGKIKTLGALGDNVKCGKTLFLVADTYTLGKYGLQGSLRNCLLTNLDNTNGNVGVGWEEGFTMDGSADLQAALNLTNLGPTRPAGIYTVGDFVADGALFVNCRGGRAIAANIFNVPGTPSGQTNATNAETFAIIWIGSQLGVQAGHWTVRNTVTGLNQAGTPTAHTSSGISHQGTTGCLSIGNHVHHIGFQGLTDNACHHITHLGEMAEDNGGSGGNIEVSTHVVHDGCVYLRNAVGGGTINSAGGVTSDSGFINCTLDGNGLGITVVVNSGSLTRNFVLATRITGNTSYGVNILAGATGWGRMDMSTIRGVSGNNSNNAQFWISDISNSEGLDLLPGEFLHNHAGAARGPAVPATGVASVANPIPAAVTMEITAGAGGSFTGLTINGTALTFAAVAAGSVLYVPVRWQPGRTYTPTYTGAVPAIRYLVDAA